MRAHSQDGNAKGDGQKGPFCPFTVLVAIGNTGSLHISGCPWRSGVGTLPHTDGETEARVPNAQSGVFLTPLYSLLGDPTKPLFVRAEASQKLWQLPWATPAQVVRAGLWLPFRRLPANQVSSRAPQARLLAALDGADGVFSPAIPIPCPCALAPRGAWCPVSLSLNPRCS